MATRNRQIMLASRPTGMVSESNFRLIDSPVPAPRDGQVLLKIRYLSVDPYMRGRMSDRPSYVPPVNLNEVMCGSTIAEVVESKHSNFKPGDIVESYSGWQEYAVDDGKNLRKIDPSQAPVTTALGILGMPGMTAYFGMKEIAQVKAGDTVVVSGAAGAVGSAAGQIAKILGCRTVGIAGSDEKVRTLKDEYGFDEAFNYKTTTNYAAAVKNVCPNGVDAYFDNVGGAITDGVLANINSRARIAICGQISLYNTEKSDVGPRPFPQLLIKEARAEGFLVYRFYDRSKEAITQLAQWLREGKLKYHENIVEGIENAPRAFIGLFRGENTGKQLVKVS